MFFGFYHLSVVSILTWTFDSVGLFFVKKMAVIFLQFIFFLCGKNGGMGHTNRKPSKGGTMKWINAKKTVPSTAPWSSVDIIAVWKTIAH